MKKFLIILGIVFSTITIGFGASHIRHNIVTNNLSNEKVKMMPEYDFLQPGCYANGTAKTDSNGNYVYNENGDYIWVPVAYTYDECYEKLYKLKNEFHYKGIIIQMTRSEESYGVSSFYYPTEMEKKDCYKGEKANIIMDEYSNGEYKGHYSVDNIMKACHDLGLKVFMGLSVEEISWWALTCYYDDNYMNRIADIDCVMVEELYKRYCSDNNDYNIDYSEDIVGWYFAYELFSNPIGWENLWAKPINKVIDKINSLKDGRPLMFSPFRQPILGNVTSDYLMWKNFFNKVNFRDGDIFAPQDSMGKLKHDYRIKTSYTHIFDYLNQCQKAAKEAKTKINFWVNVEYFHKPDNGGEADLVLGEFERVEMQIKNANRVADKLISFSACHYMCDRRIYGDEKIQKDFDDYQIVFNENYKKLLNQANA